MSEFKSVLYELPRYSTAERKRRGEAFLQSMSNRRSVREFSSEPVPRDLIELAITTASTAPSGAHRQPWRFVAVSDVATKRKIRIAAEEEERESYEGGRMPEEWLDALAPIGTDWHKPYLETVPWLVVVFEQTHGVDANGNTFKNYYVKESVGIACGLFITSLHQMGLATLTHTPSPMAFLSQILQRPANEKPYVLLPVGYPTATCRVPDLRRKVLDEVVLWV